MQCIVVIIVIMITDSYLALIILQSTLLENRKVVYTSHDMQYECVTKANTFVLLTIQSRTFTKGFIQRGPIFPASTYCFFFHRCAPRHWRRCFNKWALSLFFALDAYIKEGFENCKRKAGSGKVDFSNCNIGRPLIK